jgi:hypothetical protein
MTSPTKTMATNPEIRRRYARAPRIEAPEHLFAVGQSVQLKEKLSPLNDVAATFTVTGLVPKSGDTLQYRIRSEAERHERVMAEDRLEPAGTGIPNKPSGKDIR